MTPMEQRIERQIKLEEEYSHASIIAGIEEAKKAMEQDRFADINAGHRLLVAAYEPALDAIKELCESKARGQRGKYVALLRRVNPEIVVVAALRQILNACANNNNNLSQDIFRGLGRIVETEALIQAMMTYKQGYTERTITYLDSTKTKSVHHRYRTLTKGAENVGIEWERWSSDERVGVGRLVITALYDSTGLFEWDSVASGKGSDYYILRPTPTLERVLQDTVDAARAIVKYPPMLVPPVDWESQWSGGYLTPWFNQHAKMCSIRGLLPKQRKWVLEGLGAPRAAPLRSAMNRAQNVAYRVDTEVLALLNAALATRRPILGLPKTSPAPKPEFPFSDGWQKDKATDVELERFQQWKAMTAAWHTEEQLRASKAMGIILRANEIRKYKDEPELYFPTFIDWRGRVYMRSTINPQNHDSLKGCLQLAEGKRLGERGLFWLKVHVANCAGYDKHDPALRVKWVDENFDLLSQYYYDPLNAECPEPDTAFTLFQAVRDLVKAYELDNPEDYVSHIGVAMDATCSGLQHFSALLRDSVGGLYTNLVDGGGDVKQDIYRKVSEVAVDELPNVTDDEVIQQYWSGGISRTMAKKPVMTYVYGSTLKSTMDDVVLNMNKEALNAIIDDDGETVLYSQHSLSVPVAKALRVGVVKTVPAAAAGMDFLKNAVRQTPRPLQWYNPVGVPVVNWGEDIVTKRVTIASMGIYKVVLRAYTEEYSKRAAAGGISPNLIHSYDSGHLCMTLNSAQCSIVPIHDSFATHACDVDEMHSALRRTFVEMYSQDLLGEFIAYNEIELNDDLVRPENGNLDLNDVLTSRFMFT